MTEVSISPGRSSADPCCPKERAPMSSRSWQNCLAAFPDRAFPPPCSILSPTANSQWNYTKKKRMLNCTYDQKELSIKQRSGLEGRTGLRDKIYFAGVCRHIHKMTISKTYHLLLEKTHSGQNLSNIPLDNCNNRSLA